MNTMNVDLILAEIQVAKNRLEAQRSLAANSEEVYQTATSTGSHALARIASVRLKRHREVIAETERVLAELQALLPSPPAELALQPSKPPAKGGSHSSRT